MFHAVHRCASASILYKKELSGSAWEGCPPLIKKRVKVIVTPVLCEPHRTNLRWEWMWRSASSPRSFRCEPPRCRPGTWRYVRTCSRYPRDGTRRANTSASPHCDWGQVSEKHHQSCTLFTGLNVAAVQCMCTALHIAVYQIYLSYFVQHLYCMCVLECS